MSIRKPVIAIAACFALAALPASAAAQSAGDEQYVDPLSGLTGGDSGSGSGAGDSDGTEVGEGAADVAGSAEGDAARLPAELARTGLELPLVVGAGALLLAGGIGLRRLSGEHR